LSGLKRAAGSLTEPNGTAPLVGADARLFAPALPSLDYHELPSVKEHRQ
jgi:hypothetical protein